MNEQAEQAERLESFRALLQKNGQLQPVKCTPNQLLRSFQAHGAHPLPIHFHLIHSNTIHSTIMAQKHLKMQHLCKQLEGWKSKSLSKRKIFWHSLGRFESCGAGWCCNGAGFDVLKLLPD
jgi:hypothetical protein